MLDRFERDKLREIEHQISAADPELAAFLRGAQGRLPRPRSRIGLRVLVALLVLLTAGLLVLGLLASALVVSTVAAVLWRWRGSASSTRGGDALCLVSGRRQRSARGARCGDPPPSPMCATPGGCCGRASTRCPRSPTARGRCRREQCLKPVDDRGGSYPPDHLQALKQDRRSNAGREGTTRAHRSSWSCRRR
jgi:hypothetical protein